MKVLLGIILFITISYTKTLTLKSCIDKTLKNHPDIKTFSYSLLQSKEDLNMAQAEWRPNISAHLEYDPTHSYLINLNGKTFTKDDTLYHSDITLTQRIFDFKKTDYLIDASKIQKQNALLSLEQVKNDLRLKVEQTYDQILLQKKVIKVKKEDLKNKKELYKQALALQKQGLKTQADSSRMLASVANAKEELSVAYAMYEKAINSLKYLIGEKIPKNTTFENHLKTIEKIKLSNSKKRFLLKKLKTNPILKKFQNEIKRADKLYKASKSERYGTLDASLIATHEETLSKYDTKTVALKYQLPLYQAGKLSSQIQKSKISINKAKSSYESMLIKYKEQLESLFIDLKQSDVSIKAKKASIRSAKKTYYLIKGRYKEGLVTYVELLDALYLLENSKFAYINELARKSSILYQIKSLTGEKNL